MDLIFRFILHICAMIYIYVKENMPGKPIWYDRINEIHDALERSKAPVLDRAAIERLFGLKRRQAINLMARFKGFLSGRHWLVHRQNVLDELVRIAHEPGYGRQIRARRKLSSYVEEVKARRVEFARPIAAPTENLVVKGEKLPAGVYCPRPGQMVLEYASVDALLAEINALAMAAVNDFAGFSEAVLGEEREP